MRVCSKNECRNEQSSRFLSRLATVARESGEGLRADTLKPSCSKCTPTVYVPASLREAGTKDGAVQHGVACCRHDPHMRHSSLLVKLHTMRASCASCSMSASSCPAVAAPAPAPDAAVALGGTAAAASSPCDGAAGRAGSEAAGFFRNAA
eukprot:365807-Chlamydomonas_euryale.AAC.17